MQPASHNPQDLRGTDRPIRIGGTVLRVQRHICAFFNSQDDEYAVLLPFIKDGLECGDKAVHIVDPGRRNEHIEQLRLAGIDVAAAQQSGQFELREWAEAHLQGGFFDQDRTLALIDEIRHRAKEQGFPRIRFVTHMGWALEDRPGVEGLLQYEASANLVPFADPVVCAYDLAKFDGEIVVDIMRTHPVVIIGGILQENPFYVAPDEFLRELRERGASSSRVHNRKSWTSVELDIGTEHKTREIRRLRRCMNDLVSTLALPAMWTGHDHSDVPTILLDVLVPMLDLDFGYVRASDIGDGPPKEWIRSASGGRDAQVDDVSRVLAPYLADDSTQSTQAGVRIANPLTDGSASIAVFRLGIQDSIGVFVAGSRRSDFPTETERVLLQVATNQAGIALQEARRIARRDASVEIERMRSKAALQKSEERFRQMADSIPEMIQLIINSTPALIHTALPDGGLDFFNQTWLKYVGLSLKDLEGWKWTAAIHPADVEGIVDRWRASLASGEPFQYEARVRRADGEYRWMLHHKVALRDEHGKIVKWYGSSIDIEDRKRAEEEIKRLKDRLQRENIALREEIDRASMFEEIVGNSAPLRAVLLDLSKVAPTDSTVLITGETGTGKELVARAIHRRSPRSARAFVSVNCAAIPPSLIASELFGHEKGAFTGAVQRRQGRFELADGGTLFLDEVGELPPEIQIALLRVLQEREFERVGGNQPIRSNVRVIAASNRDLEVAVRDGLFRADLFYRLNVFPLEVPPLRERRMDIPLLVEYFSHRFAVRAGKNIRSIDKNTLDILQSYEWPGNIRELQNVVERAVIVCDSEMLSVDERWLSGPGARSRAVTALHRREPVTREKDAIEAALTESRGRVAGPFGAARRLGLPPSTLESKIRALNIEKSRFKQE